MTNETPTLNLRPATLATLKAKLASEGVNLYDSGDELSAHFSIEQWNAKQPPASMFKSILKVASALGKTKCYAARGEAGVQFEWNYHPDGNGKWVYGWETRYFPGGGHTVKNAQKAVRC